MTCPGLKLLMGKLKQLIYSNDIPLISNHPSMLSKRPQLQLLYEELGSVNRILYGEKRDHLHDEHEHITNLKKTFNDVANEACDAVDLFVSIINFKNKRLPRISNVFEISLNLEDVMRSIKSIKEDFISILHNHNMKMESSSRTDGLKTQSAAAAGTSWSRNSPISNKLLDESVVGLDRDIDLIRDKLAEDTKKLDVVSIVGMGGIGKTTLATKVFNDDFVRYHFRVRGWVTVSQTYEKTNLLNQILASLGVEIDPDKRDNYSHLHEKLHKRLMGQRYLVVIDDIWNTEAWDDLKVVFPHNNMGSRLLLTSRHKIVALHAKPHGFIHHVRCLTDEESWELLHMKVFHGYDFPEWLTLPGMQIARNCHGLPLAVVVIAGVLAKEPVIKESWERISQSGIVSNLNGHMETLALSLNHLPSHLRDCFLYLGGFPEDYRFRVTRLMWLWIAEGFIQETESQSLEETAKDYLMELVNRNLVVVQDRKFNGAIKTFSVHDVLREICLEVGTKERFLLKLQVSDHYIAAPYKTRRIFTDSCIGITNAAKIRSLLSFYFYLHASYIISKCSHSWTLLVVLDLQKCHMNYFPDEISSLVNLRYLAIWIDHRDFPSTICHLWGLQTLIIESHPLQISSRNLLMLPNTISNLVNLRHFRCRRAIIFPPLEMPLINLQTISNVVLGDGPKSWVKYFSGVKKLSCFIYPDRKYDFKSLTFLEILKIRSMKTKSMPKFEKNRIRFPASLKELTLQGCRLPWSCMYKIQSLPNLEVLILLTGAFVGRRWDAGDKPFQQLKLLKLIKLNIEQWEASSINFPCLKQLFLMDCCFLKGIPPEIGYVPTLEHIQLNGCSSFVTEMAYKIQEEQHADGNYDLKISSDREIGVDLLEKFLAGNYVLKISSDIGIVVGLLVEFLAPLFDEVFLKQSVELLAKKQNISRIWNDGKSSTPTSGLRIINNNNNNPPAYQHLCRSRIWSNGRSKYGQSKRKI